MKARKEVNGPGSMRNALRWAEECLGRIIAGGGSGRVIIESFDGPTAKMRGKFHAMCDDIARQVVWYGSKQHYTRWKAIFIGAAIEQEWLPGLDGKPVPYRPSSENLSRKKYCECITIAQVFGDEQKVIWSEKAKAETEGSA